MNNYLVSETIGDIAGSAYGGKPCCIKDYDKVKMFSYRTYFTDDTVLTFAYAEATVLAIFHSLGRDADTLAAIAGPMAYAFYKKMPDALVYQALKNLPNWMVEVSERVDDVVNKVIEL